MNCQNFENVIDDLARGALMDARSREGAHAHAAECARCGARLADGHSLTAGLRTLAGETARAEAPARVEAALVAAFRARRAQTPTPAPVLSTASAGRESARVAAPSASPAWWLPRWAQGAAVAAASMLLVFGLYGVLRNQTSPQHKQSAANPNPSARPDGASVEESKRQQSVGGDMASATNATATPDGEGATGADDEQRRVGGPVVARKGHRSTVFKASHQYAGNIARRRAPTASVAADAEIATEFIPLMNGGRLTHDDAGHVMRVELPRSALASFGLPVNADRAEARVKADVLMGEDGIARAIRFVR